MIIILLTKTIRWKQLPQTMCENLLPFIKLIFLSFELIWNFPPVIHNRGLDFHEFRYVIRDRIPIALVIDIL